MNVITRAGRKLRLSACHGRVLGQAVLTVDGGSTAQNTNIYQYEENNTLSQAFRLTYNSTTEAFAIRAMCSNNGNGSALTVRRYEDTVDPDMGYVDVNAILFGYNTALSTWQDWLIMTHGQGKFKVVMRADPNLALTSYGTGNGTSSGTTSTSGGNIFVSQFTGSANQLWVIESGDNLINIAETSWVDDIFENDILYFYYADEDYESSDTVVWTSSNENVATINTDGNLTAINPGFTTITANITHSNGNTKTYNCTVYVVLEDGLYSFQMEESGVDYHISLIDETGYGENEHFSTWEINIGNVDPRLSIFKTNYLGRGIYTIRSMLDNSIGWTISGANIVSANIGSDNEVESFAKWRINSNSLGCYIQRAFGNEKQVVTAPDYPDCHDDIYLSTYVADNIYQTWDIVESNFLNHGVEIRQSINKLLVGSTFTFSATMYSSYPNANGQNGIVWSVSDTSVATINSSTGVLTGVSSGVVTVTATYTYSPTQVWSDSCSVEFTADVIDDVYYTIMNVNSGKALDVWNAVTDEGTDVIQYTQNPKAFCQTWKFEYVGNGDYKIIDVNSGKLLTVASNSASSGANIQINSDTNSSGQLFRIRKNSNGSYSFLSKCSNYTKAIGVPNSSLNEAESIKQLNDGNGNNLQFTITADKIQVYLCVCDDIGSGSSSGASSLGHAWIEIKNTYSTSITIGYYSMYMGEYVSIGRIDAENGNSDYDEYDGIWYNMESYKNTQEGKFNNVLRITTLISISEFNQMSLYTRNNSNGYNLLTNNCVKYAIEVWNLLADEDIPLMTSPFQLQNYLEDTYGYPCYETSDGVFYSPYFGCYYDGEYHNYYNPAY